jgi:hypothetical protein
MLPNFKLAMVIAKLANSYSHEVLHVTNVDLLTKDLGDALRRQKKIITDPDMGTIETATEVLPVIAEVKLLTMAVSKKLDIDTKGKSVDAVLSEIIEKTEARDSDAAKEIKVTLDWTRSFFSHPEIQEILKADLIPVDRPESLTDLKGMGKGALQQAMRVAQSFSKLHDFLKKAKTLPEIKPEPPKPERKPRPKKDPGNG